MYGIYEDLFGASESNTGAYLILAGVVFMMIRAAPSFLKEVLPNFRVYPVIAGGIAFWWLLLSGKFVLAFVAMMAGMIITVRLSPAVGTEASKAAPDAVSSKEQAGR